MIGLPSSGKSRYSTILRDRVKGKIVSSDALRKELLGDEDSQEYNSYIFTEMRKRTQKILDEGENVIYDATNINRKRRQHLINNEIKADNYYAVFMANYIHTIKRLNSERSKWVPNEVINRMYKSLEIPVLGEGWGNILYIGDTSKSLESARDMLEKALLNKDLDGLFGELLNRMPEFDNIYGLPHDNPHHTLSVSEHTFKVVEAVRKQSLTKNNKLMLLWSAVFHDLGKAETKSFKNFKGETKEFASFIGHEYVSSQLAVYYLSQMDYGDSFVASVGSIVQFHMYPMKAKAKKMNQVRKLIGNKNYMLLQLLHEADKRAK